MKLPPSNKNIPRLFFCMLLVLWHSLIIIFYHKTGRLTPAIVNKNLRCCSFRILKTIKAHYQIKFMPGFSLQTGVPYIFMSNHMSLFDLPLIYANLPGTIRLLIKDSLFKMPLFGNALKLGGFLGVDRKHPNQMQTLFSQAKEMANQEIMLWIFPEGTRSGNGRLLPLKMGGFRLARELKAHIIPVGIMGTDKALPTKTWLLQLNSSLKMTIGNPIDANLFPIESQTHLMNLVAQTIEKLCFP